MATDNSTITSDKKRVCEHMWERRPQQQYCRVPLNGLPNNGQAGILSKNKNYPRLENWVKNGFTTRQQCLLWRRLLQRHCWLRNDSTSTGRKISASYPVRRSVRVQHRYQAPCTRYKLSYVTRRRIEKKERDWLDPESWKIRMILAWTV